MAKSRCDAKEWESNVKKNFYRAQDEKGIEFKAVDQISCQKRKGKFSPKFLIFRLLQTKLKTKEPTHKYLSKGRKIN